MTLTGAIQEGKLGETGQRTDKTGDNKQEEDKKEKKDYTGYPSEPVKRRRRNNQERELHWVPQEFTNNKQGSKLVCSASTGNAKLNKKERVNLKQSKLRKTPPPSISYKQNRLTGTCVLFLRQYYPSPFILDPSKLTQAKHPRWMFAPTS